VGVALQLVAVAGGISGWVIVKGGHCTRNDWALAVSAAKQTITTRKQRLFIFLLAIRPTSTAVLGGCCMVAVTAAPSRIQALTAGSQRSDKRCQTFANSIHIYAKSHKSRLMSWLTLKKKRMSVVAVMQFRFPDPRIFVFFIMSSLTGTSLTLSPTIFWRSTTLNRSEVRALLDRL
jgi:hypothetical protein